MQITHIKQLRGINVDDALRFADLLSKSTHLEKADTHKIWAHEIITMLLTLYPDDEVVKYYAGSVLTSTGNFMGRKLVQSQYEEPTAMDELFSTLSDLFLEQYVNPNIHHWRWNEEEERREHIHNAELVEVINRYIDHDGYKLVVKDTIGDKDFYECISTRVGVQGQVKNIIFAAKYKPEIAFDDALNNDIRITRNENHCLIYNRSIPSSGVMWNDLVEWYAAENNLTDDQNPEVAFITRLCDCLDTSFKANGAKAGPETWMLHAYYNLKKELGIDLPALIPQVYLYYDPQTLKQRGYKLFEHQKMDFLMIFSHKDRIVIEIDGKQHYAEGATASPKLYSEMVRAHREMSLLGYDVYRFGGYEFMGADADETVKNKVLDNIKQFFVRLFCKYGILREN